MRTLPSLSYRFEREAESAQYAQKLDTRLRQHMLTVCGADASLTERSYVWHAEIAQTDSESSGSAD